MAAVYLPTACLAPVQYYCKLLSCRPAVIETAEHYPKQTCRNRYAIAGANGVQLLTVPVEKPDTDKCPTKDIRISDHGHWRHRHWHALVSAYASSPFFEYYRDDFAPFYTRKFTFLLDFNEALRQTVCELLDMHPEIEYTSHYEPFVPDDWRSRICPKRAAADPAFLPQPYRQVFQHKHGFLPNLSIVDLLFNMGPESTLILQKSSEWRMNDER
jgi:hypothetical protein